jgi:hypothetical protein
LINYLVTAASPFALRPAEKVQITIISTPAKVNAPNVRQKALAPGLDVIFAIVLCFVLSKSEKKNQTYKI